MTLVEAPALPYATTPDEDGDRLTVDYDKTPESYLFVDTDTIESSGVQVLTADRLPFAAVVAGTGGYVFAVPEGGLPALERCVEPDGEEAGWRVANTARRIPDAVTDDELLAALVARAAARKATATAADADLEVRALAAAKAMHEHNVRRALTLRPLPVWEASHEDYRRRALEQARVGIIAADAT